MWKKKIKEKILEFDQQLQLLETDPEMIHLYKIMKN